MAGMGQGAAAPRPRHAHHLPALVPAPWHSQPSRHLKCHAAPSPLVPRLQRPRWQPATRRAAGWLGRQGRLAQPPVRAPAAARPPGSMRPGARCAPALTSLAPLLTAAPAPTPAAWPHRYANLSNNALVGGLPSSWSGPNAFPRKPTM